MPVALPTAAGSRVIDEESVIVAVLTWIADPSAPVLNDVAVTTPDATNDVRETSGFSESSTPLLAAAEVRLVPPVIAKDSERRSISSEPLSPVTVKAEPTAAAVAEVMRPLESTVITGTADPEPYDPAETPLAARVIGRATFPVPSNVCPESVVASPETVKVLAFAKAVAVAAFPEVSWLPVWFTPGRLMSAEPLKETPPMFLAVSRIEAEDALPVTSPTNPLEAVTTPEATTLVREILSSRLTVTELLAAFKKGLYHQRLLRFR